MIVLQVISLVVSVSGVCMVGFYSTRSEDDHSGSSNYTNTVTNSSIGDDTSQTDNTPLGILVLY